MLAAGSSLGPYQVLAPLGSGGMGEVYRARDTRLSRDVAIKVIPAELARDPERIKRFEQEARAAGALNHPNVCTILDIGSHEGAPFVVMELLEGETLRHRIEQGPVPARKALDYAAQAAHGLAAAHEKGIVHRDLKPENLFLTKDGRIKVLDFGLAKLTRPNVLAPAGDAPQSIMATETGAILGTVGYMAPEQVLGKPADARSDLFALGAILYELLTGKRAFHGASYIETLHAILNEEPAALAAGGREIPTAAEPIVRRCLEKNPQERFQNARDLAFSLEGLGGSASGSPAAAPAKASPAGARTMSWRPVAAAFLVGALLVIAIAFLATRHGRRTDASQLRFTRLTVERGNITVARFTADGSTVLYSAKWGAGRPEIYETRPGLPASRSLGLADWSLLSVSADGRMAVRAGPWGYALTTWGWSTLAEVPVSGGAPRNLLNDVQSADWAPGGRGFALSRNAGSEVRLEFPPGRVLYRAAGGITPVRVSPDAEFVAFIAHPVPGDTRGVIVIEDTSGHVAARTREWSDTRGLAWSADGREVWYVVSQDQSSSELRAITPRGVERVVARFGGGWYLLDVNPNGRALLTQTSEGSSIRGRRNAADSERELGWFDCPIVRDISPDGRMLLFEEEGVYGGPQYAVCIRGMDGSPPVRLGEGRACALSPDARRALAINLGPPQRLVLLPTGAGDSTCLPRGKVEQYYSASWTPDGRSVVFSGSETGHGQRSYIQDVKGGPPRPITPVGISGSKVSPDGSQIAAVSDDQRLFVCSVRGDGPRFVAQLKPNEEVLRWTADGHSVFVAPHIFAADPAVARIDLATGGRSQSMKLDVVDPAGLDGLWVVITPDGQGYACSFLRHLAALYLVEGLK